MSKKERKDLINKLSEKEYIEKTLSNEHDIREDICLANIGLRLIQIIYNPSFEQGYSWDIRKYDNELHIYRSLISEEDNNKLIPGYIRLTCDSNILDSFIKRLSNLIIHVAIGNFDYVICDGTYYEISLFNSQNSISLNWMEEEPSEWLEIRNITKEMIKLFLSLKPYEKKYLI